MTHLRAGTTTKFNALGTLETGTSIRDLLAILHLGEPARPFATAEKPAELGVLDIARQLEGDGTLADLLDEVTAPTEI